MAKLPTLTAAAAAALIAVMLPAGIAAGQPEPTADTASASPSPSASASASPSPSASTDVDDEDDEDVDDGSPRLDVEADEDTVSQYRHLGVELSGTNLPPSASLGLTLDGRPVQDVSTTGGGTLAVVTVRFPALAAGDHVLALELDDEVVADEEVTVDEDFFAVTVSPRWITADLLRTKGASLRVGKEHGSYTMDQDFDAFVLRRIGNRVEEVQVGRGSTRRDGSVEATVKGGPSEFPAGVGAYSVGLRSDFLPFLFAYTDLRITRLTAERSADDGAVTGGGFEPGSTVELVVDGETVGSRTATSDATVRFAGGFLALRSIVLRSPAGEVAVDVPALPDEVVEVGREIKAKAAIVETIQETRSTLRSAVGAQSLGKSFTPAQTAAVQQQVVALEKLFGAFPAHSYGSVTTKPGPVVPGVGFTTGEKPADAGSTCPTTSKMAVACVGRDTSRIGVGIGAMEEARAKDVDAEADRAAAQAEQARQVAEGYDEIREAMKMTMQQIINFIKELQDAEVDAMRAITRASTPTVVARQVTRPGEVVTVDVPASFRGRHHVVVIDPASGIVTAVQPFDASGPAGGAADAGAPLPAAGADVAPGLAPLGLALLVTGGLVVVLGRRRHV